MLANLHSTYVLYSKLLNGGYVEDYIGVSYRAD